MYSNPFLNWKPENSNMKSFTNIIWWVIAVALVGLVIYTLISGTSPFEALGLGMKGTTIVFSLIALVALVVPSIVKKVKE